MRRPPAMWMTTERLHVACDLQSPRQARRFAARLVAGRRCADDVELLTSELVTNAVQHARTAADVTVDIDPGRIRIEVVDASPRSPERHEPNVHGGRGLLLVEQIATRWGVISRPPGKAVWFEIDEADPT